MNQKELANILSGFERLRCLNANWRGKDYFVGDIGGQYTGLKRALHKTQFDPRRDRLFCTGNLIDPGTESPKVLTLLEQPWFFTVLGVHELMMLDALKRGHYLHWYMAGGQWAFNQDLTLARDLTDAIPLLHSLPIAFLIEQRKYPPIGLISKSPPQDFTKEGLASASLMQLLDCLIKTDVPNKKRCNYHQLDAVILGGEPARKSWAKGNIAGINLGASFLPQRGSLVLFKRKKVRKTIDHQVSFQSL